MSKDKPDTEEPKKKNESKEAQAEPSAQPAGEKKQKKKGKEGKADGAQGAEGEAPKKKKVEEEDKDFRYIVRLAQTDVDGHRTVEYGLTSVKGISHRLACIIADKAGLPRSKKMGKLTDDEIAKLGSAIENIGETFPYWMLNRQMDPWEGADGHMIALDVDQSIKDDINMMKKVRTYKGVRHEKGQKVRGQRTRSNGRSGLTVGVIKSAAAKPASSDDNKKD